MSSDQIDVSKTTEIAQKIVALLSGQGEEVRRRAISAAMMLLGTTPTNDSVFVANASSNGGDAIEMTSFFEREGNFKPADFAQLCAAYHFSMFGFAPFTFDDLREIAGEAGIVIPDRLDMTIGQAKKNGKKLFQSAGRGQYKPTAAAGVLFRDRWDVRPGKKPKSGVEGKA